MTTPFVPACTPAIQRHRNELFSFAVMKIGTITDSKDGRRRLDRSAIPHYLNTIGCPILFTKPLALVAIAEDTVRTEVDDAAKNGYFDKRMGMVVYPSTPESEITAMEYAAVTSSEFLRRSRCVAWRSAEGIFAVAPRRVIHDEDDELVNEEFFTLTHTYELLVISGIQPVGHTEFEERTFIKVLNERRAMFLPTVVVLAPAVGHFEPDESPIAQYLLNNFLTVTL